MKRKYSLDAARQVKGSLVASSTAIKTELVSSNRDNINNHVIHDHESTDKESFFSSSFSSSLLLEEEHDFNRFSSQRGNSRKQLNSRTNIIHLNESATLLSANEITSTLLDKENFNAASELHLLPLLLMIEKKQHRDLAKRFLNAFFKWKGITLYGEGVDSLEISDVDYCQPRKVFGCLVANRSALQQVADESINDVQMLSAHDPEITDALNKLCRCFNKHSHHRQQSQSRLVRLCFGKWKGFSNLWRGVERSLCLGLQVLLALHHSSLWTEVFSRYCQDKRRLLNLSSSSRSRNNIRNNSSSNTNSKAKPEVADDFGITRTSSQFTLVNPLRGQSDDAHVSVKEESSREIYVEHQVPETRVISFEHYDVPLLGEEELWTLLRDCKIAPSSIGRRQLTKLVLEAVQSNHQLPLSPDKTAGNRSPVPSSNRSPVPSSNTINKSSASPSRGNKERSGVMPKNVVTPLLSFNDFVRLLWRLAFDLLQVKHSNNGQSESGKTDGDSGNDMESIVHNVRKVVRRRDRRTVYACVQLVSKGQWRKFIDGLDHAN